MTAADFALRTNRSPGPVAIEVARRLARDGAARILGPERARQASRLAETLAAERGLDAVSFNGVDRAWAGRLAARFAAANDAFAQLAWGQPWPACVADRAAEAANEIAGAAADPVQEAAAENILAVVREQFAIAAEGPLRRGWSRTLAAGRAAFAGRRSR